MDNLTINRPQISLGLIIRKTTLYILDRLNNYIKEINGIYGIKNNQKVLKIKEIFEEQHSLLNKLKKVIKFCYKSQTLNTLEIKSAYIYNLNNVLSSFKYHINELFFYSKMFRIPSVNFKEALNFISGDIHQDIKKNISYTLRNLMIEKDSLNTNNCLFLEQLRNGKSIDCESIDKKYCIINNNYNLKFNTKIICNNERLNSLSKHNVLYNKESIIKLSITNSLKLKQNFSIANKTLLNYSSCESFSYNMIKGIIYLNISNNFKLAYNIFNYYNQDEKPTINASYKLFNINIKNNNPEEDNLSEVNIYTLKFDDNFLNEVIDYLNSLIIYYISINNDTFNKLEENNQILNYNQLKLISLNNLTRQVILLYFPEKIAHLIYKLIENIISFLNYPLFISYQRNNTNYNANNKDVLEELIIIIKSNKMLDINFEFKIIINKFYFNLEKFLADEKYYFINNSSLLSEELIITTIHFNKCIENNNIILVDEIKYIKFKDIFEYNFYDEIITKAYSSYLSTCLLNLLSKFKYNTEYSLNNKSINNLNNLINFYVADNNINNNKICVAFDCILDCKNLNIIYLVVDFNNGCINIIDLLNIIPGSIIKDLQIKINSIIAKKQSIDYSIIKNIEYELIYNYVIYILKLHNYSFFNLKIDNSDNSILSISFKILLYKCYVSNNLSFYLNINVSLNRQNKRITLNKISISFSKYDCISIIKIKSENINNNKNNNETYNESKLLKELKNSNNINNEFAIRDSILLEYSNEEINDFEKLRYINNFISKSCNSIKTDTGLFNYLLAIINKIKTSKLHFIKQICSEFIQNLDLTTNANNNSNDLIYDNIKQVITIKNFYNYIDKKMINLLHLNFDVSIFDSLSLNLSNNLTFILKFNKEKLLKLFNFPDNNHENNSICFTDFVISEFNENQKVDYISSKYELRFYIKTKINQTFEVINNNLTIKHFFNIVLPLYIKYLKSYYLNFNYNKFIYLLEKLNVIEFNKSVNAHIKKTPNSVNYKDKYANNLAITDEENTANNSYKFKDEKSINKFLYSPIGFQFEINFKQILSINNTDNLVDTKENINNIYNCLDLEKILNKNTYYKESYSAYYLKSLIKCYFNADTKGSNSKIIKIPTYFSNTNNYYFNETYNKCLDNLDRDYFIMYIVFNLVYEVCLLIFGDYFTINKKLSNDLNIDFINKLNVIFKTNKEYTKLSCYKCFISDKFNINIYKENSVCLFIEIKTYYCLYISIYDSTPDNQGFKFLIENIGTELLQHNVLKYSNEEEKFYLADESVYSMLVKVKYLLIKFTYLVEEKNL